MSPKPRPPKPSPFAASLLFGYVRRLHVRIRRWPNGAPPRSRWTARYWPELLGQVELRELLDRHLPLPAASSASAADRVARDARKGLPICCVLRHRSGCCPGGRARVSSWLNGAPPNALVVSFAGRSSGVAVRTWPAARRRWRGGSVGLPASFGGGPLNTGPPHAHTPFTTAAAAARISGLRLRVTADVLGRLASDERRIRGRGQGSAGGRRSGVTPSALLFCGAARWPH